MSDSRKLFEYIQTQHQEQRLQKLLEVKGYADQGHDTFGLNQWTRRLTPRNSFHENELPEGGVLPAPDHLVSFLLVPANWHEDLINTNSPELRTWLSEYKWQSVPGLQPPFSQINVQACSEGLLLPGWVHGSEKKWLETFLLVRQDGVIEFGLGREAYDIFKDDTIFQLIQIVGRLWQFLAFVCALYERFIPDFSEEVLCIVNMRGTEATLMGNLAEGWKQPVPYSLHNSYRPRCLEKNIQIRRWISYGTLANEVEETVRWFATRIENGWGQFEPRCYVHEEVDDSRPFAMPTRK